MGTAQPRSRAAYGAWALTALLSTLLLVAVPVDPLLDRLGIHKGLSRGTIGYVRLLKVGAHACAPVRLTACGAPEQLS